MYVSDIVTLEEIEQWKDGDNILIKSQTGTGKSYFIMNNLARFCEKHKLKTLIFSNRDLLKKQNEKLALKNVDCLNYQFIEQLEESKLEEKLSRYDIINFDECHYFFKDASFNYNTDKILHYLLKPTKQIRIFSSATPEPLYYAKLKFTKEYDIPKDYSFIKKLIFYDDISDIFDEIIESDYKTICFFSNATKACRFAYANAALTKFYCSQGNPLWQMADKEVSKEIVANEKFETKILATTTVLDNGVNLNDNKLRNIIIDFYDPITIIQTLGRKRIHQHDKVNLYLRVPTRYDIIRKAYLKNENSSLSSTLYLEFLKDHFKEIRKIGYIYYWCDYFKFSTQKAAYINKYGKIKDFMKAHCNKSVAKEELEKLFSEFMPVKQNARLVTYNKFLEKNLLNFKIVSKRQIEDKVRKRKLFIESVDR